MLFLAMSSGESKTNSSWMLQYQKNMADSARDPGQIHVTLLGETKTHVVGCYFVGMLFL